VPGVPQERDEYDSYRREQLSRVWQLFDLDGTGHVCTVELSELGVARRELGHKKGEWSEEKNRKMFASVDKDGSGTGGSPPL